MATANDVYTRGREVVVERPFTVVAGVVSALMLFDLLRRLVSGTLAVSQLATFAWDGLTIGFVIGLAGVGLSMTYSILNFANFAHGDYVTTGAFTGWMTTFLVAGYTSSVEFELSELVLVSAASGRLGITITGTPLAILLGAVVAAVLTALLVVLLDRIVYRPMRDQGGIPLLIASIGVALALRYLIVFVYGTSSQGLTASDVLSWRVSVVDGTVAINAHEVTLVVVSAGLMVGMHLLLQRTKLGTAMRAMADNKSLAQITGIPTERVVRWTWLLGGGLAGVAGYLIALERGTISFNLGWLLLLLIFAAVILGGIGSIYGAMFGGIIIGLVSRISLVWIPSDFARAAAFFIMILVLLFKPNGLFGGKTTA